MKVAQHAFRECAHTPQIEQGAGPLAPLPVVHGALQDVGRFAGDLGGVVLGSADHPGDQPLLIDDDKHGRHAAGEERVFLRGAAKAALLVARFGLKGFDYAGNSHVDLQVWSTVRCAIVVNGSEELVAKASKVANVAHVFPEEPGNPCRTPW